MTRQQSRRQFLKQSAVAGVGFWVVGGLSRADDKSANGKLNIACIGVGGKGQSDTEQAGQVGNVVALCDCDDRTVGRMAQRFPKAKKYNDFRKMLEEMDKQIDAVTVSTPDNTHAVASIMAMKMGKHVYCQKPLTHDVYEARQMAEVAAKHKCVTQMGNQGTAENGLREAVEVIRSGAIGPVREVHVWTNRPIWPQAPDITARPNHTDPVPPYVHWDLFLGPAPERPYVKDTYHPFKWRGWWDFGTGALGDMACHTANMAFMALKLGHPTSVAAEAGDVNTETCPSWATVTLEFPARESMPPVRFFWYEGKRNGKKNLPPLDLLRGEHPSDSGSLMVGDKGTLYSPNDYGAQYVLLPKKDFEGYKPPEKTLPRNGRGDLGMKEEWVAGIKGGPAPVSNFSYAGLLTEAILLGNVAIRVGRKFDWDGPNLRAVGCPEADAYIRREYRKGWTL